MGFHEDFTEFCSTFGANIHGTKSQRKSKRELKSEDRSTCCIEVQSRKPLSFTAAYAIDDVTADFLVESTAAKLQRKLHGCRLGRGIFHRHGDFTFRYVTFLRLFDDCSRAVTILENPLLVLRRQTWENSWIIFLWTLGNCLFRVFELCQCVFRRWK